MKYGVNRQTLLLTAGIVWLVAGANILRIGLITWFNSPRDLLFKVGEATVVFLLFFLFVFKKLYDKHTRRIEQKTDKSCPFSFFDVKGWIIMTFMDCTGHYRTRVSPAAQPLYLGVLYRLVTGTHVHRITLSSLLVEEASHNLKCHLKT